MDVRVIDARKTALPWGRAVAVVASLAAIAELGWMLSGRTFLTPDVDRWWYMDAARRFLETGQPYGAPGQPFLHPPITLYLFVPFVYLPAILWYAVPLAILGWFVATSRPSPTALAAVALCLAWPRTPAALVVGNTDVWVAAFVALGLRFGWPAVLVLVKPSLAPLALVGIRRRSWWLGLAVLAVLAVPFGMLWFDWFTAIRHAPGNGVLYSLWSLPLVLLPLAARRQ